MGGTARFWWGVGPAGEAGSAWAVGVGEGACSAGGQPGGLRWRCLGGPQRRALEAAARARRGERRGPAIALPRSCAAVSVARSCAAVSVARSCAASRDTRRFASMCAATHVCAATYVAGTGAGTAQPREGMRMHACGCTVGAAAARSSRARPIREGRRRGCVGQAGRGAGEAGGGQGGATARAVHAALGGCAPRPPSPCGEGGGAQRRGADKSVRRGECDGRHASRRHRQQTYSLTDPDLGLRLPAEPTHTHTHTPTPTHNHTHTPTHPHPHTHTPTHPHPH